MISEDDVFPAKDDFDADFDFGGDYRREEEEEEIANASSPVQGEVGDQYQPPIKRKGRACAVVPSMLCKPFQIFRVLYR